MTSEPLSATSAFRAFYDGTARTAFGLALRITNDSTAASAVCEKAYSEAWQRAPELGESGRKLESFLLERVRSHALPQKSERDSTVSTVAPYTRAQAVRDSLAELDPAVRRAIDLAYFGGLPVSEIAEMVGMPAPELRRAMRSALLALGARLPAAKEPAQ